MRKLARESAFQLIYEYLFLKELNQETKEALILKNKLDEDDVRYLDEVLNGVVRHQDELEQKLESVLNRQRPERIFRCDKSILLLALYEMLCLPEIPEKVSINEAIELSKIYSTEKSGSFINGILSNFLTGGGDHGQSH